MTDRGKVTQPRVNYHSLVSLFTHKIARSIFVVIKILLDLKGKKKEKGESNECYEVIQVSRVHFIEN